MKSILSTTLLFVLFSVYGQEKKVRFGLQAFPNFSTGIPKSGTPSSEYYKGIETFTFSYSAGIQIELNVGEKWKSSNGFLYKTVGERGKTIPNDPNRGFLYPMEYGFKLGYLELQINMQRKFGENWFLEFGVSPSYMISAKYGVERDQYFMELGTQYRNSFALNCNLGFGYATKVGIVDLKFLPYAQYDPLIAVKEFFPSHGFPDMNFFAVGIRTIATL